MTRSGREDEMADTKIAWAPWEEREVPGFGRVFRVEVTEGAVFRARELALQIGEPPELVLNMALNFGLAMAKEKGLPPTIPT